MPSKKILAVCLSLVIAAFSATPANAVASSDSELSEMSPSVEKSLGRETLEGSALVIVGSNASSYVLLGGLAEAAVLAPAVALVGAGAIGYGLSKIARGIDNKTGKHLYKASYVLIESTHALYKTISGAGLNQDTSITPIAATQITSKAAN